MYVGDYHSGKFQGRGIFNVTQASTHGQTTPATRGNSSKAQGKVMEYGWPTILIPTPIDTRAVTNMTKRMASGNISGKMGPLMRGTS